LRSNIIFHWMFGSAGREGKAYPTSVGAFSGEGC
jgi:hypothetical protein